MIRLFYLICLALCLPFVANAQTYSLDGVRSNVVIDVRTPEEFASGHIDGAINIPYDQIEARRSAAPPVSFIVGLPEGRLTTPMSRQNTLSEMPVPSALEQASLAANRLA